MNYVVRKRYVAQIFYKNAVEDLTNYKMYIKMQRNITK